MSVPKGSSVILLLR